MSDFDIDGLDLNHSKECYLLRLYVTGSTPKSKRAIENMRHICEKHLEGRYDLEVIDIYQQPEAAIDQQVVAVPTLIKLLPGPLRRIIGDLSETEKILHSLDLSPLSEMSEKINEPAT
jgi:circadian clock protein KaiB